MNKIRLGIIGTGGIGSGHAAIIKTLSNAELTAVCDINPQALEQFKSEPQIKCFTDSETFFEQSNVDAVIISTPHFFHHTLAIRALEKNLHVLVEKPVSVHKNHAEALNAAIAAHPDLVCCAMFCQRTSMAHQKIKQLLDSGELGEIRRVNWIITDWFRTQSYYDSGDWRASYRGEGGGVLLNQCPHQLDLLQWFCGMPSKISAHIYCGKYHDIEVEDEVTAFMEYPNGATGVFIASTGEAPGTNRLEITGDRGKLLFEKGVITFERTESSVSEFCRNHPNRFAAPDCWQITIPANASPAGQHKNIIVNFLEAIANKATLTAPAVEGIRSLEIGNAMVLSSWLGKTLELPIDADLYEKMLEERIAVSRYTKKHIANCSNENFSASFGKIK